MIFIPLSGCILFQCVCAGSFGRAVRSMQTSHLWPCSQSPSHCVSIQLQLVNKGLAATRLRHRHQAPYCARETEPLSAWLWLSSFTSRAVWRLGLFSSEEQNTKQMLAADQLLSLGLDRLFWGSPFLFLA